MAKMSDLAFEVEWMLRNGFSVDEIVDQLGVPFQWVLEVRDWMDFTENQ